jgi:type VI protein secretion system component Hcp
MKSSYNYPKDVNQEKPHHNIEGDCAFDQSVNQEKQQGYQNDIKNIKNPDSKEAKHLQGFF